MVTWLFNAIFVKPLLRAKIIDGDFLLWFYYFQFFSHPFICSNNNTRVCLGHVRLIYINYVFSSYHFWAEGGFCSISYISMTPFCVNTTQHQWGSWKYQEKMSIICTTVMWSSLMYAKALGLFFVMVMWSFNVYSMLNSLRRFQFRHSSSRWGSGLKKSCTLLQLLCSCQRCTFLRWEQKLTCFSG